MTLKRTIKQAIFEDEDIEVRINRIEGIEEYEGHYYVEIYETKPKRSLIDSIMFRTFEESMGHVRETFKGVKTTE